MLEELVLKLFDAAVAVAERLASALLRRILQNTLFVKGLYFLTICAVAGITIYIVLAGVRKTIKEAKLK